jgi:DUF1009 family protein
LEQAVAAGYPVVLAAIREEAFPELVQEAERIGPEKVTVHWVGLGQLGKLIRIFTKAGVKQAVMAGQVKHGQIFAPSSDKGRLRLSALPDLRMARLLLSLKRKNTDSLIGAVADELGRDGIELLNSTFLVKSLLPEPGTLTDRPPTKAEVADIEYGRSIARRIADLNVGQTIVVRDKAVVAVEAMEGTDETVRRAARLTLEQPLTVIKVTRPGQDMRFDVPVIGLGTLEVFQECKVSALCIDAGRTLMLDRVEFIRRANLLGMTVVAEVP